MDVALGVRVSVGLAVLGEALDSISEGFSTRNDSVKSCCGFCAWLCPCSQHCQTWTPDRAQLLQQSQTCSSRIAVSLTVEVHSLHQVPLGSLEGLLCLCRCKQGVLQPARAPHTCFLQQDPVGVCSFCTTQRSSAEFVVSRDKKSSPAELSACRTIGQCGNGASLG